MFDFCRFCCHYYAIPFFAQPYSLNQLHTYLDYYSDTESDKEDRQHNCAKDESVECEVAENYAKLAWVQNESISVCVQHIVFTYFSVEWFEMVEHEN